MNSGPLSLRRIIGIPLVLNIALSTAFTSMDVKAVPQRMARERRVNSSVRVRIFRGCSLAGLVEDEVVGPDVVRILGLQREMLSCAYFSAQSPGWEGEPFALPNVVNRLAIHYHTFPDESRMDPSTPPARVLEGYGFDPCWKGVIVLRMRLVRQ